MTFHIGEMIIQTRVGVREEAERLCMIITNKMKPAAQEFLQTQRIAIASTIAANGSVWASLLTGSPGFIQVLDERAIEVQVIIPPTDALHLNLHHNPQLGLLVIDLTNRRRLRLNGIATVPSESTIQLQLQQVFFNCPKYIQTRHLETVLVPTMEPSDIDTRTYLTESDCYWLTHTDTFFIATAHSSGADASHRGGYPGFIQIVSSNRLVFPDCAGNNMFQTFGNLAVNPTAGLLLIDFDQGHTLQLTGQAEILWDSERAETFQGAKRWVEFTIEQILETRHATALRWQFGEFLPALLNYASS